VNIRQLSLSLCVAVLALVLLAGDVSAQSRNHDSLKNGAVIGAVIGAAALGTFGGLLCNALHEPGTPSCWSDTLRIAAIGAGIGLGAGVAVDAAFARRQGVALRVRITF
jgi:hypothetical protein